MVTEPVVDNETQKIHTSQNGGTRHLAASLDGYFTVFSWSEKLSVVQAHRIDVLLL